jgi:[ribosomal protein S18]-alanine N-acetyltransferase
MINLFRRWIPRRDPKYSEASLRDAVPIAALHAASFHRGWSEVEIEGLLVDRQVLTHRAMHGEELAGFIMSRMVQGEAEILSVAVAPAWRGRGVARRLLDVHMRQLASLAIHTLFLEVGEDNTPARRLYRGIGFREVGRRDGYYRDGPGPAVAALVLRRDL